MITNVDTHIIVIFGKDTFKVVTQNDGIVDPTPSRQELSL